LFGPRAATTTGGSSRSPAVISRMVKLIEELLHLRERAMVGVAERFDSGRVADTEGRE